MPCYETVVNPARLDIEKYRLIVALQADIEAIDGVAAAGLARTGERDCRQETTPRQ